MRTPCPITALAATQVPVPISTSAPTTAPGSTVTPGSSRAVGMNDRRRARCRRRRTPKPASAPRGTACATAPPARGADRRPPARRYGRAPAPRAWRGRSRPPPARRRAPAGISGCRRRWHRRGPARSSGATPEICRARGRPGAASRPRPARPPRRASSDLERGKKRGSGITAGHRRQAVAGQRTLANAGPNLPTGREQIGRSRLRRTRPIRPELRRPVGIAASPPGSPCIAGTCCGGKRRVGFSRTAGRGPAARQGPKTKLRPIGPELLSCRGRRRRQNRVPPLKRKAWVLS